MKNKTVILLAILFAVGCNREEVSELELVDNYADYREENEYTKSSIIEKKETVEIYLDSLLFGEAFSLQLRVKGEGKMFWWRGNQYTTDLKEKTDESNR